ncbi:MAG: hypothetical protein ABIT61_04820 [Steroidobacteraceae bacterium]
MQALLAGIYDLPQAHDVYDFLITDPADLPPQRRAGDEQVLVATRGDDVAMALFLDAQLLRRLEATDPTATLNAGNLADCLTALEGVSHFICLAWNACHDKQVSLLELELQAEVDKYIASFWLLRAQDPRRYPLELHRLLFKRARVDATLAGEREGMYATANTYAARFCRRLEAVLCESGRSGRARAVQAMSELRRFYRLSNARKLSHIEHLA